MKCSYNDITSKLGRPLWWDENGCPRYVEFSPRETANIYAVEAMLLQIACQNCGTVFEVCLSCTRWDSGCLALDVQDHRIHYGDPPNFGCCQAGPTMNSESQKVLQFWQQRDHQWERVPKLEISLE